MNRAKKRHQKNLARKALKKKRGHPPQPSGQTGSGVPADKLLGLAQKGLQLHQAGQLQEAETVYRQILDIKPDFAEAHNNLGNVLRELGRLDDAVATYHKTLALKPDFAEANYNLGNALRELGQLDDAVASYDKAIALNPDYAKAHNNLGNTLKELGRFDDAVASFQKAIALKPDFSEANYNLGNALQDLGSLDAAAASYYKAISHKPDYAIAHNNLGTALNKLGQLEESLSSYEKALAIDPDYAEAHNNLGVVLQDLGRLEEAAACYRKSRELNPDYTGAVSNHFSLLLNLPGRSPEDLFAEHLRLSESHARGITPMAEPFPNDPAPERRLRVGYLSSDFWDHAVGKVVLPLLSSHDQEIFEIYCYADVPRPDAMTERFRSHASDWRSIADKPDEEVAKMVRADLIDVLVCMAGRFDRNRPLVCAHRAAPVQVSFHDGATSGFEDMDYWLTDNFLHPADTKELFTEELLRLPVLYQFTPFEDAPAVKTLPADHAGFITFGSFNNPAKINEDVIRLWAEVLKSVPDSRLRLKYRSLYGQATLQDRLLEGFEASGIAQDRILFTAFRDTFKQHLGLYGEVDIALDPFPFNGSMTTFQALWMGVPVISLVGETFISRTAGSMLHHAGLGEFAVNTPEAYVASARDLAGDLERLRILRANLRERMATSPICNAPAHTRSVETAYRDMWRKWCAQPKNIP